MVAAVGRPVIRAKTSHPGMSPGSVMPQIMTPTQNGSVRVSSGTTPAMV
jgi:hypothetical protein